MRSLVASAACLLALLAVSHAALEPCTQNDIDVAYTSCLNNERSAYYYYKVPCDIEEGVQLPPTVSKLACDIACGEGAYLPIGKVECADCQPGGYSIGGGDMFDDWTSWPQNFVTDCSNFGYSSTPCKRAPLFFGAILSHMAFLQLGASTAPLSSPAPTA